MLEPSRTELQGLRRRAGSTLLITRGDATGLELIEPDDICVHRHPLSVNRGTVNLALSDRHEPSYRARAGPRLRSVPPVAGARTSWHVTQFVRRELYAGMG
jgi:hypothetical protein